MMIGLLIVAGVRPPLALSGFGGPPFWVLVTVLFYGFAMKKTGLAERLSYYILSLFPGTYSGILTAFFVIGFVLALGIPSMTVRTAIMVPIAWALAQSLGLETRSRGAALIVLTTIEMAVIPGIAFLYGSLDGPIVAAAFEVKHLPLTWLGYAQVITFPTLLLCALILIGNQFILRPEAPLTASPGFARKRLRELGSFKRPELVTAIVVAISIVFWATTIAVTSSGRLNEPSSRRRFRAKQGEAERGASGRRINWFPIRIRAHSNSVGTSALERSRARSTADSWLERRRPRAHTAIHRAARRRGSRPFPP